MIYGVNKNLSCPQSFSAFDKLNWIETCFLCTIMSENLIVIRKPNFSDVYNNDNALATNSSG